MNSKILAGKIKISIVMPVYNTEKYFARCIESLLKQTYKNLEVIIVDDCSSGNIKELSEKYIKDDSRVRIISHEKNKGLFQARLTGAKIANGDYIAFIDSDDYVSNDYYHTLLEAIVEKEADIAIGKTVYEKENGYKYIYNFHNACFEFEKIQDKEVKKKFFGQKGLCYSWHTIWNKLYKKELWDKCVPYYEEIPTHVIMTEDIAFSTVLFYFANVVTTVKNDAYFYCANEGASTNTQNITFKKFEKNMQDIQTVFDFCEDFLNKVNADDEIKKNFYEFRKYYARMWRRIPEYELSKKDKEFGREIIKRFCKEEERESLENDFFFSSVSTEWRGGLEEFKRLIANSKSEYVSFDIFDTLVNRPFDRPTDLFYLMNKEFEKLLKTNLDFYKVRIDSEAYARNKFGNKHPEWEDVTIDEIYECMSELYHLPLDVTDQLREREKSLEIEFCATRFAGKELFEVAQLVGKKIIIVSDMYLKKDTIETILKKNGYAGYDKLYLSSELRLTKHTGHIFDYVKKDLQLVGNTQVYHIGDTWQNDYINAEKAGFLPLFFPKAKEVFENKINGVRTNDCSNIAERVMGEIINKEEVNKSIGYGCMLAMTYNRYFDNPYRTFNAESDFNIDPNFMGYYVVGMHMVGVASWILEICKKKEIDTIHFLARDGYLPMKAYDILTQHMLDVPKSNYLYASRRLVMCGMIKNKLDFYGLPIEYRNHSPKTLLSILKFAARNYNLELVKKEIKTINLGYEKVFVEKKEYFDFLDYFVENLYDEKVLAQNQKIAKEYYSIIKMNDITFDMGYSGRIQNAISNLVEDGIDVLFIHSDNAMSSKMKRSGKFDIYNYYDFVPFVSGLLREHLLSDYRWACSGFDEKNGAVEAVLKPEEKSYQDEFCIGTIQNAAIEFVNDFYKIFGTYIEFIPFSRKVVSLPFEGYIRNMKYIDRKVFAASSFEDLVYGASDQINIEYFINNTIPHIGYEQNTASNEARIMQLTNEKGVVSKSIIIFLADKRLFKRLVGQKLKRNAVLYTLAKKGRGVYDRLFLEKRRG